MNTDTRGQPSPAQRDYFLLNVPSESLQSPGQVRHTGGASLPLVLSLGQPAEDTLYTCWVWGAETGLPV